jgi:hypothetical protein
MNKEFFGLFYPAFLQIFFVSICTFCIAERFVLGAFMSSFCINWLWSANVKKAAFGGKKDRIVYASGAACGSVAGLLLMMLVQHLRTPK